MTSTGGQPESHQPSEFERRRALLIGEIGDSLESVLTQLNSLNRSLEGIIEIGNEFASVEALWSQFESVMGNQPPPPTQDAENETELADEDDQHHQRSEQSGRGANGNTSAGRTTS